MTNKLWFFGFSFLAAAVLGLLGTFLFARADPVIVLTAVHGGIEVDVKCAEPITHSPHIITVTITNGTQDITITHKSPTVVHVIDLAHAIGEKLSIRLGLEHFLTVTGQGQKRTVQLPPGWTVKSVDTRKLQGNNPKNQKGHVAVRSTTTSGHAFNPVSLGGPPLTAINHFASFTVAIEHASADPLAVDFSAKGIGPAGGVREIVYAETLASEIGAEGALDALQDFLERVLGATVTRPTPSSLMAVPNDTVLKVFSVTFGAHENKDLEALEEYAELPPWQTTTSLSVAF